MRWTSSGVPQSCLWLPHGLQPSQTASPRSPRPPRPPQREAVAEGGVIGGDFHLLHVDRE